MYTKPQNEEPHWLDEALEEEFYKRVSRPRKDTNTLEIVRSVYLQINKENQ